MSNDLKKQIQTYLQKGNQLKEMGKLDAALEQYYAANQLDPEQVEISMGLGDIYERLGELDRAEIYYKKAAALDPDNSYLQGKLAWYQLRKGSFSESVATYQKAFALSQQQPASVFHGYGDALNANGNQEEAIAAYKQAIKLNPEDSVVICQKLGDVLSTEGRFEEAIAIYKQGLELQPENPQLHSALGGAQKSLGETAGSAAFLTGMNLLAAGNLEGAVASFQQLAGCHKFVEDRNFWPIKDYLPWPVQPYELGAAFERLKTETEQIDNPKEETTNNQQQITNNQQPTTNNQQPTTNNQQPTTNNQQWPKITVVTPSFNQGDYIESTILSVLNQEYPNLEYIIVDSASTDKTREVLARYEDKITAIIVEKDRGQANGINKGFARATGELMTWLNSDDMLAPGALYMAALTYLECDWDLMAGICVLHQNQEITTIVKPQAQPQDFTVEKLADLGNLWYNAYFFHQPEVIFTRKAWDLAGGQLDESLEYVMDYDLWMRFAQNNASLAVINWPMAFFRKHEKQKTGSQTASLREHFQVRNKYYTLEPELERQREILGKLVALSQSQEKRVLVLGAEGGTPQSSFGFLTQEELSLSVEDYSFSFSTEIEGLALGDFEAIILPINLAVEELELLAKLKNSHHNSLLVGWFWQNHRLDAANGKIAQLVDICIPAHGFVADYLQGSHSIIGRAVPLFNPEGGKGVLSGHQSTLENNLLEQRLEAILRALQELQQKLESQLKAPRGMKEQKKTEKLLETPTTNQQPTNNQQPTTNNQQPTEVTEKLAQMYLRNSNFAESATTYEAIIEQEPHLQRSSIFHGYGDALKNLGKVAEAIVAYEQALQGEAANSLVIYEKLADTYQQEGRLEEATTAYEHALALEPSAKLYKKLGISKTTQRDLEGAIAAYRQALKIAPEMVEVQQKLEQLLRVEQHQQEWQWLLEAAGLATANLQQQKDPWLVPHLLVAKVAEKGDLQKTLTACNQAIALDPSNFQIHYYLGRTLAELGRLEEAIESYERTLELSPENLPEIHGYLAEARKQIAIRHLQESFKDYGKALGKEEGDLEALQQQLVLLLKQILPSQQRSGISLPRVWRQTSQKPEEQAKLYLERGKQCGDSGKLDEAIVCLKIALEFDPDSAPVYFQLGNVLKQQNDLNRAIACYQKAVELEPHNCWYYNGLGDALTGKWDLEEAVAAYQRAISIKPDFDGFQQNLTQAQAEQKRWQRIVDYCGNFSFPVQKREYDPLNILMITPYPPYPPNTGGAMRMFEQIKYLGRHHHLTVVSFIFEDEDYKIEEELQNYCDMAMVLKLGAPRSPRPVNSPKQIYLWDTWNMGKVLTELKQLNFDVVLFDFIFSTPYHSLFRNGVTILNEHNIESNILKQLAQMNTSTSLSDHEIAHRQDACATAELVEIAADVKAVEAFLDAARESKLLEEYENRTWGKFTLRTTVSEEDRQEIQGRSSSSPLPSKWKDSANGLGNKTIVIKNGIDTRAIIPVDNATAKKMLYMGTMAYYPNIDAVVYFTEEILPHIRAKGYELPFCIAGRNPATKVQELVQRDPHIEVLANPESMREVARDCSMAVVPLRLGSGTRIKILEAMAMGLPVISTSIGCEGLEVIDGENILIRDQPEEFAEAAIELSTDAGLRNKLRLNGRSLVEQKYDWQHIFAQYEREIIALVSSLKNQ